MKRRNWTEAKETLFYAFTHNELDEKSNLQELDEAWGIRCYQDYYRCCGVWGVILGEDYIELGKSIQRTFPRVYEKYKDGIDYKASYADFVRCLLDRKIVDTMLLFEPTSYSTADAILITYI